MAAQERPPCFLARLSALCPCSRKSYRRVPHPNDASRFCLLSAFVQVSLCAFDRVAEILLVDDVVPIEDGARRVSTDRHRNTLRDTGPNQCPQGWPHPRRHPLHQPSPQLHRRVHRPCRRSSVVYLLSAWGGNEGHPSTFAVGNALRSPARPSLFSDSEGSLHRVRD